MIKKTKLIYEDLTYKINGILFDVHNEIGRFSNEKQYGDSIQNHLTKLDLKFEREKMLEPSFEGETKGRKRVDFLIENKVILELKTKHFLDEEDYYQIQRYLKAMNLKLGILINFRQSRLVVKRILNSNASEF